VRAAVAAARRKREVARERDHANGGRFALVAGDSCEHAVELGRDRAADRHNAVRVAQETQKGGKGRADALDAELRMEDGNEVVDDHAEIDRGALTECWIELGAPRGGIHFWQQDALPRE
jgi:hypothetical protein